MSKKQSALAEEQAKNRLNNLTQLYHQLPNNTPFGNSQISSIDTTAKMLRQRLITVNRSLLSYLYLENGLVQTGIDMPVRDAFRGGVSIQTKELNETELEEFNYYCNNNTVIESIKQAIIWSRLFGGGGIIIETGDEPNKKLDYKTLKQDTQIKFYPVDLWELSFSSQSARNYEEIAYREDEKGSPFLYYGTIIDRSRVFTVKNRHSPSLTRPVLRGWGVSEIEHILQALNVYQKLMEFIFEATDEAKIDVYKMEGYNTSLLASGQAGSNAIATHLSVVNQQKNYHNALVLDATDDYIQKQLNLSGFDGLFKQATKYIANAWGIPENFLFGQGSSGLNSSNEEELQKYNSMLSALIRDKHQGFILDIYKITCQKLFGFVPKDLELKWEPLQSLTTEQEETRKDMELRRLLKLYDRQIITSDKVIEGVNQQDILGIKFDKGDFESKLAEPESSPKDHYETENT